MYKSNNGHDKICMKNLYLPVKILAASLTVMMILIIVTIKLKCNIHMLAVLYIVIAGHITIKDSNINVMACILNYANKHFVRDY